MRKKNLLLTLTCFTTISLISCSTTTSLSSSSPSSIESSSSSSSSSSTSSINEQSVFTITFDFGDIYGTMSEVCSYNEELSLLYYSDYFEEYECLYWTDEEKNQYAFDATITITKDLYLTGEFQDRTALYKLNEDGETYSLNYVQNYTSPTYTVLSTYNNKPVTTIKAKAFFTGNSAITKLIIPNTIQTIELGALSGLTNLEELEIPFIGNNIADDSTGLGFVFGNDEVDLQSMIVPSSLSKVTVTEQTNIPNSSFANTNISEVILKKAEEIGRNAFSYMSNLVNVSLNEGVKVLNQDSFNHLDKLEELNFPESLETFDDAISNTAITSLHFSKNLKTYAYSNNSSKLSSIVVDEANPYFSSDDGILYSKDQTKLLTYPCNKQGDTYRIKDSVVELGNSSFMHSSITSIDLNNVTKIGNEAFMYSKMPSIDLTNITTLGDEAFRYSNLTSVFIPSTIKTIGKTSFSGISSLTSITFSDTNENETVELGNFIFSSCPNLTSLVVPNYIVDIPQYFVSGDELESLTFLGSLQSIDDLALSRNNFTSIDITFKDNATIGDRIFNGCDKLTTFNIHFEDNVTNYPTLTGKNGFGSNIPNIICDSSSIATSLKEKWTDYSSFINEKNTAIDALVIDNGVVKSFNGDETITEVIIPDGVTEIAYEAFKGNNYIQKIVIPSSITTIYERAFNSCYNLKTIEFKHENTEVINILKYKGASGGNFNNCISNSPLFLVQTEVSKTSIKNSLSTNRKSQVFLTSEVLINEDNITSLDGTSLYKVFNSTSSYKVPDNITTIYNNCFSNDLYLTSIDLNNVQTISPYAFYKTLLTSIVFPESVTLIDESSFESCEDLTSIQITGKTVLADYAFSSDSNLTTIDFGTKLVSIGEDCFASAGEYANDGDGIESIIVPGSVTNLAETAFEDFYVQTIYLCFSEDYASETFEYGTDFTNCIMNSYEFDYVA